MSFQPPQSPQSPFGQHKPYRVSFSIKTLLILMVVAVGATMLIVLALRVPAFSSELRAYMGLPELQSDTESARKAHLFFLLYLYASPLGLGIIVFLVHHVGNLMTRLITPTREDPEFEMNSETLSSKRVS